MSQSTHRQRRNEKTFEDLPPRVIIYDILNYHEIILDYSLDEFDLFGYYKRDSRRRSVWFLFQSLDFSTRLDDDVQDNSTFPVVKIEKLHSLQLGGTCNFRKKKVFKSFRETLKRTNMYLLKRISFCFPCESLSGLFSSHNRFPKLTHLEIYTDPIIKDWKWDVDRIKSLQETLTCLDISISVWRVKDKSFPDFGLLLLGNNDSFSSLKKVSLASIHFTNVRTIHLPHLEEVYLSFCRNLVLFPGSNVSSVILDDIQPNDLRELFLRSNRINNLQLRTGTYELFNNSNNWFYEESTNPMENLCSLKLTNYLERSENFETFLERIKDQLIKFKVYSCIFLQEDLLENGFKKLEVLEIENTKHLLQNETKWEFASRLRKLVLNYPDPSPLSILFKRNHLSSLEILKLDLCIYEETNSSLSFPPLKNLKELRISNSKIGDLFFAEQDFENLETMKIKYSDEIISGKGWKRTKFNKLRKIRVYGESVTDDLFKLIEFPALRKLDLWMCMEITGEGWLPMPNLCEVSVGDCHEFSNEKILKIQNKGVK